MPDVLLDLLDGIAQDDVAKVMAVGIVDGLEMIDIEHCDYRIWSVVVVDREKFFQTFGSVMTAAGLGEAIGGNSMLQDIEFILLETMLLAIKTQGIKGGDDDAKDGRPLCSDGNRRKP